MEPPKNTEDVAQTQRMGWLCPVCGLGVSPDHNICPRCVGRAEDAERYKEPVREITLLECGPCVWWYGTQYLWPAPIWNVTMWSR